MPTILPTILIVDDSRVARLALKRVLAAVSPGAALLEAANADEAEAVIAGQPADAALIDFNMPGRNGLELAAALRERHPGMLLVLCTANIQDSIAERARALGAGFLPKPVGPEALAAALASLPGLAGATPA